MKLLRSVTETKAEKTKLKDFEEPLPDFAFLFLSKEPQFELTAREKAAQVVQEQERRMEEDARRRARQQAEAEAARARSQSKAKAKPKRRWPYWH